MLTETVKKGDWKGEKHVPVIEIAKNGDVWEIEASVGKEIAHPNTPEHHISWIELYFHPENGQFPFLLARAEFANHSDPLAEPFVKVRFKTEQKGKIYALSYCNLHGLWENETELS